MAIFEQDKVLYEEASNGDKTIIMPVTRVNNVEGLGRSANTKFVAGEVVYVDNYKKIALKCIVGGTTGTGELDVSSKAIGETVKDGSVTWQVCNRTSDVTSVNGQTGDVVVDLPVGHMYFSVEPTVPTGRLPAFGALYNRSLYADLWAYAQERGLVISESQWQARANANGGNCAYYSDGDGSTTFRVPSLKCWVKGANGIEEVGSYLSAGLPNITGGFRTGWFYTQDRSDPTGAFGVDDTAKSTVECWETQYNAYDGITFNASKSNAIYGNSNTVQPPSIVGMFLIVAFGVAHNIGEADVANVMQAIESTQSTISAVDNKITGISDYIVESYRNGTEWYEVYKSGKIRQGGSNEGTSQPPNVTINFLKPFANNKYNVNVQMHNRYNQTGGYSIGVDSKTTTTFVNRGCTKSNSPENSFEWIAEGQGA